MARNTKGEIYKQCGAIKPTSTLDPNLSNRLKPRDTTNPVAIILPKSRVVRSVAILLQIFLRDLILLLLYNVEYENRSIETFRIVRFLHSVTLLLSFVRFFKRRGLTFFGSSLSSATTVFFLYFELFREIEFFLILRLNL